MIDIVAGCRLRLFLCRLCVQPTRTVLDRRRQTVATGQTLSDQLRYGGELGRHSVDLVFKQSPFCLDVEETEVDYIVDPHEAQPTSAFQEQQSGSLEVISHRIQSRICNSMLRYKIGQRFLLFEKLSVVKKATSGESRWIFLDGGLLSGQELQVRNDIHDFIVHRPMIIFDFQI